MGLLKDSSGSKFQPITDINGFEDAFGWMDFKVAGTDQGITAIQLDIKNKGGLTKEVFIQALAQAKAGRKVIMDRMRLTLSAPRAELSELVPKMVTFKIEQDRIGAVIGSGGKIIREIIEKTNVTIDIEDDGTVNIFGTPGAGLEKAISWVKTLAGKIETNAVYEGKVRRITDFGIFVELVPGLDGLLHISNIPRADQASIDKLYPTNSDLKVVVLNYDADTGRIKLGFADKDKQNKGA
jgi:polyribonucleotide nucleotidyltransferase